MVSEKLAIAVNMHRESPEQIEECVSKIQMNMPKAKFIVFANDSNKNMDDVCINRGVKLVKCENYGNNQQWYLWWKRMLEWFLYTERPYFLKLDPDTMVDREPKFIPSADYFGTIEDWFIQGGCTGISRKLAIKIISENKLTEKIAKNINVKSSAFADDKYLAKTILKMGFCCASWSEIKSRWRIPIKNEYNKFAIVHPRYIKTGNN